MIIKGVYCLTSPNGKRYVGVGMSNLGIHNRWSKYKNLHCSLKKQPKLYNALKKYGPENFIYEVVLVTDDTEKALRVEKQLIALWGLQNDKFGYNIQEGGGTGSLGLKQTEESNIKRSKTLMGRKTSALQKLVCSKTHKGKILSDETKQKIRESRLLAIEEGRIKYKKGIIPKMAGWNRNVITVQHKETGELFTGSSRQLSKELHFSIRVMINKGKTRHYILINKGVQS